MKKAGFRKLKRVEISEDYGAYKKGQVLEMHPNLARKVIEAEAGKPSTKKLTNAPVQPKAVIKKED